MSMEPAELTRAMRPIVQRYPEIAAAWLFGSAAKGQMRPDIDVDIGLLFAKRGATALEHHRLLGDLASRLEAVTAPAPSRPVLLAEQGPVFAHNALVDGMLICDSDPGRGLRRANGHLGAGLPSHVGARGP